MSVLTEDLFEGKYSEFYFIYSLLKYRTYHFIPVHTLKCLENKYLESRIDEIKMYY